MSEIDPALEAAKQLGVKELVPEIYKDLLQPAAKEVGNNLVTVAKFVSIGLEPLAAIVWAYDSFKDWLSAKVTSRLSHVNAEDIKQPPTHLAGAVLTQLPFVLENESLRDMYANLLASSMDANQDGIAHVAFAHVIQQLSPDEAKIINHIALKSLHIVAFQIIDNSSPQTLTIHEQFDQLCHDAGVKNRTPYLVNLIRLGILGDHEEIEHFGEEGMLNLECGTEHLVKKRKTTRVMVTDFGDCFIRSCVSSHITSGSR
ncbi:MAG: DUF4393 domain-containing protein [Pseudomonadota bacterium]